MYLFIYFLAARVIKYWKRLPIEVAESPFVEIFRTQLGPVLNSLLWLTLLEQVGLTR